jgi:peptide/nickel transport system permease protein
MLSYVFRRILYMLILLWIVSIIAFVIIQLPPGDYLTSYITRLQQRGQVVDEAQVATLTKQYGLDQPMHLQYLNWFGKALRGNFGMSFQWNRPVNQLLAERLPITVLISVLTIAFTYIVAVPAGIYSATHQYSPGDYAFTVFGFIGLATPNFLLALILMLVFNRYFGISIGGLFSPEFLDAPWSFARFLDMLAHLPVPIIVIGTAGTAGLIRVMRGCLLDELQKQYVVTARSKGVRESRLLFRYPVRVALSPIVSTIGWLLPAVVSGEIITAIVLDLPTVGGLLFGALMFQDMYLAGSIVMMLTFLTILGTFISDVLLAVVDPRIRFERGA